jgi:hypothetical protein
MTQGWRKDFPFHYDEKAKIEPEVYNSIPSMGIKGNLTTYFEKENIYRKITIKGLSKLG